MGKQTGPIIVGFLCAHIATVLNIVGLVEPFWLVGSYNGTSAPNTTEPSPSKGIWKFCLDSGNCTSLGGDNATLTSTAQTMQGLDTAGTGFVVLALACTYIFFFCGKCNKSRNMNGFIVFSLFVATACLLAGIIFYSQRAKDDAFEFSPDYIVEYGYAFYLSIAGCCVTFLAMVFSARVSCLMKQDMVGYESI